MTKDHCCFKDDLTTDCVTEGLLEDGLLTDAVNDVLEAFPYLETWEEHLEAYRRITGTLGREICPCFASILADSSPLPMTPMTLREELITGHQFKEQGEHSTISEVVTGFSALSEDEKRAAWEWIAALMHELVAQETATLEEMVRL